MVKEKAAQRNKLLRASWIERSRNWPAEKLVFVDESAANERTGSRKRGWSPKGLECSVIKTLKRTERWSILPALTVNGYLPEPLIIQGSIDKNVFKWWLVNRLLPCLEPGSIIVMDNASIHHNLEIDKWLHRHGVVIEYLPPYSPDFNPIELTFHTLKAWIQRHFNEVELYPDFADFLRKAIGESVASDAWSYFNSCGYQ